MFAINRLRSLSLIAALAITCSVGTLSAQPERADAATPVGMVLESFVEGYAFGTWLVKTFPKLGTAGGDWAYDTFGGGK